MKKTIWRKRIISLVTVFALILGIVMYTKVTINAEVNETEVYVTKTDIPPRTLITKDMITKHSVPSRAVPLNAVLKPDEILGKWTVAGYGIASNSFIYEDKIVEQKELPDAGVLELKEGEVAIPLLVDLESSLGNSIIPDTSIDLYFKNLLYDEDKNDPKALFGVLASNIRVVAVKDAQAANVFNTEGYTNGEKQDVTKPKSETSSLAKIYIFAVPEEIGNLINRAKLLGEVLPIATGNTYQSDLEVITDRNDVVKYIERSTFTNDSEMEDEEEIAENSDLGTESEVQEGENND